MARGAGQGPGVRPGAARAAARARPGTGDLPAAPGPRAAGGLRDPASEQRRPAQGRSHGRGQHRGEVAGLLGAAAAVAIAGGHVGVLAEVLHLLNIAPALRSPVIAWSAGAMALTDRIVLFGDRSPQGPGHAEVYGSGLSLLRDVVLLPHARARLLLDDTPRMAVFARRFAPARCVLLETGTRIEVPDGGWPPGTRVLGEDGHVT